jgi:DNA-binding SARP family transcriptional activator
LTALTAGLPVALYELGGSPVPARWPSLHRIAFVLLHKDNGGLFIGAVRYVSWVAWLAFAIAVLTEVQATMRRRPAPKLHLIGMQAMAGKLVALVALTFAAPTSVSLLASPAAMAATVRPVTPVAPAHTVAPDNRGADASVTQRTVVVQPGDCLWTIAQHYLGSGDRYTEIVQLNLGHEMGGGEVFSDPSVIVAGWHLQLPGTAGTGSGGQASTDGAGRTGSGMPDAGHETGSHRGHASAHGRFSHPHQAAAGQGVAGRGVAGRGTVGQPGAEDAGGTQAAGAGAQPAAASAHRADQTAEVALFTLGMLAGAAVASIDRMRHRQRQYRRPRRRIALPTDPAGQRIEQKLRAMAGHWPDLAPLDSDEPAAGAAGSFDDEPFDLDQPFDSGRTPMSFGNALRELSKGIATGGEPLPPIVGIHLTAGTLDVLLSAPAAGPPPAPFTIAPARQAMCWTVDLGGPEDGAPAGPPAPGEVGDLLPGLFTAGATEAGGYLLLDLEAMRVTGCDGPDDLTDRLLVTAATELAASRWSGWYDLVLVGCDELEVLGRAELSRNLDDALDLLRQRSQAIARRLDDGGPPDVRTRRMNDPEDEDWGLTLLVSRERPTPEQMAMLLELADGPGGIAALVAGDTQTSDGKLAPALFQLVLDQDDPGRMVATVTLAYLGPEHQITVWPQTLTVPEYEALAGVFAVASSTADVGIDDEPYHEFGSPPWIRLAAAPVPPLETEDDEDIIKPMRAAHRKPEAEEWPGDPAPAPTAASRARHAAPSLNVRVLGPVKITGSAEPLLPKQAELVLALALHAPGGVSNSGLCSLLGADADHPKPADSVRQLITRTRKRLGQARDGQEYIIHLGSGIYVPHGDLILDWASFTSLARRGRAERRIEDLRAAMTLVRGEPFADCFHWWIDVALVETIRAEIIDTADLLAQLELSAGDPRAAARAARAGLAAETAAEQLWRALMRAEHEAGNPEGVLAAWTGCLDAIAEIAPGGEPHPETEELFRQLTRGAPIGSRR